MKDPSSTPPASPDRPAAAAPQPQTLPAQGERQQPSPRMPHERDESADSQQADQPAAGVGRIAHADAARGMPDTTKGRELDATYERLRNTTPGDQSKKRSP